VHILELREFSKKAKIGQKAKFWIILAFMARLFGFFWLFFLKILAFLAFLAFL
jgi:hypothetical protein